MIELKFKFTTKKTEFDLIALKNVFLDLKD